MLNWFKYMQIWPVYILIHWYKTLAKDGKMGMPLYELKLYKLYKAETLQKVFNPHHEAYMAIINTGIWKWQLRWICDRDSALNQLWFSIVVYKLFKQPVFRRILGCSHYKRNSQKRMVLSLEQFKQNFRRMLNLDLRIVYIQK